MSETIRAGMIGCDTSHVVAFAKIFNNKTDPSHVPGVQVVAAYPSFSPDLESSVTRVDKYKKQLTEDFGVKLTSSIAEMLEQVDVVMIESVDGRRHLKELQAVAHAGKPVFVDKPFAASLADAKKMVKLIKQHKLPCFSSSSLRFDSAIQDAARDAKACGSLEGCDAFGPAHLEKTNPGLFWYGIHGVEILYTFMGQGCRTVRCTSTPDSDMAVGIWKDGRLGTMRGIRKGRKSYGAMLLCTNRPPKLVSYAKNYYPRLIRAMIEFFKTGRPPLPIEETLEICAFIDAAYRSAQNDGQDMPLDL